MGMQWYVVRTKARSEMLAARELERDGIEYYLPLVKRPNLETSPSESPLFPGYLFLRCNLESTSWPSFRVGQSTLGLVSFRGEIPSLPDEVVASLRERCELINEEGGIWRRYNPGDMVQVISSTIQGLAQVVEDGKTAQSPVRVLLQFLDRLIPAQIPRSDLQPTDQASERQPRPPRRTRGGRRWIQGFGPRALATG